MKHLKENKLRYIILELVKKEINFTQTKSVAYIAGKKLWYHAHKVNIENHEVSLNVNY